MLVQIKLESSEKSRAPLIFNVDASGTIFDLKCCIEKHVNIPVKRQEILTLSKTLSNHESLATVMKQYKDLEKINGAAISLYSMNKFVCFLQFYTKNEGDEQCNFPNQPLDAKRLPIDNMPRHSVVSSGQSIESGPTNSSNRKRKQIIGCDASENRTCLKSESVESNAQMNAQAEPTLESSEECVAQIPPTVENEIINCVNSPLSVQSSLDCDSLCYEISTAQSINIDIEIEIETPPYDIVMPEQRRYTLVISNDIAEFRPRDCTRIMSHYFYLFETSQSCPDLNFSDQPSVSLFDGKFWVVCEDSDTCEWMAKSVPSWSGYKCSNFISFYGLIKCRVVLPWFVDSKDLASLFKVLEVQNQGITTSKWCVMERKMLDEENSSKVTNLCENEILTLYVDQATKHYIQERDLKIKYCFWKLTIEFCDL